MKVLVTGATGFLGNHVINHLLQNGYKVIATATSRARAETFTWYNEVSFVEYKLDEKPITLDLFDYFKKPDLLIHLAWQGLPNYKELYHIEKNLFQQYFFIRNLIENGLKNITITGTCFEYGMQSGCLHEELIALPGNAYALAKDCLRKFIEAMKVGDTFSFKWVRLFYMHGEGQNPNSIIPLLQKAIKNGDAEFNMSGGEQLRDYLPVSEVAKYIAAIAAQTHTEGIINCCSGIPVSVRKLVESYINEQGSNIKPCLGYYPYPDYEPMAFWGDNSKLKKIIHSK